MPLPESLRADEDGGGDVGAANFVAGESPLGVGVQPGEVGVEAEVEVREEICEDVQEHVRVMLELDLLQGFKYQERVRSAAN